MSVLDKKYKQMTLNTEEKAVVCPLLLRFGRKIVKRRRNVWVHLSISHRLLTDRVHD